MSASAGIRVMSGELEVKTANNKILRRARHQTPHIMWMCSVGHCALRQILFNIIIAFVCNLICHLGPINRIFSQFFRPRYEMKHYDISETSTYESAILEYSYSRARTLTTTTKVIANQYNWEFVPRSTNKNSQKNSFKQHDIRNLSWAKESPKLSNQLGRQR